MVARYENTDHDEHVYRTYFRGGAELCCQSHAEGLQAARAPGLRSDKPVGDRKRAVEGNVHRLLHYDRTSLGWGSRKDARDPLRLRRRYDQLRRALS